MPDQAISAHSSGDPTSTSLLVVVNNSTTMKTTLMKLVLVLALMTAGSMNVRGFIPDDADGDHRHGRQRDGTHLHRIPP